LIESEYDFDLKSILQLSITSFGDKLKNKDIISEVNQFCFERLKAYYHEKAISINILQALSNDNQSNPYDFFKKMNALQYFLTLPEANALSSSFKRVQNILSKTKLNELPKQIDTSLLNLEEEKSLNYVLNLTEKKIKPLTNEKKYKEILMILSELKNPIDEFFDSVMVNVDNFPLRLNRLKLLANIQELFLIITDISFL
ncbi:MAG: glycine--tRNA ligase subunit beta, partial [Francisellaceae bacterium]|nr:glycine--tRNA ligase subunit beta [Francisellaceae bacterium]